MDEQDDSAEAIAIRPCNLGDRDAMLAIINAAAEAL